MSHADSRASAFLGYGSPMNVLEENRYTQAWHQLSASRPRAIVAISAHWYTQGTAVTAMTNPRTIHDFDGFPQALFDTRYPVPGSPALAQQIAEALEPVPVRFDNEWGFDHSSWGVLIKMYPDADVPVVQISIDATQPPAWHVEQGKKLAALRNSGVMIVASGNVVHNLRKVRWDETVEPWPWAQRFNQFVRDNLNYQGEPDAHPLTEVMQYPDSLAVQPNAGALSAAALRAGRTSARRGGEHAGRQD
ncbi:LigB family dioxygenase|nr:LigB family dioxygenase [Candidatus Pantoea persica]